MTPFRLPDNDLQACVERLGAFAEAWGGRIKWIDEKKARDLDHWSTEYSSAPFLQGLGINYRRKTLYLSSTLVHPSEVIHEMAHLFASKLPPNHTSCDEYVFFGWEYLMSKKVGLPFWEWVRGWSLDRGNYQLEDYSLWNYYLKYTTGDYRTPSDISWGRSKDAILPSLFKILRERVREAEQLGCVRDGEPLNVRRGGTPEKSRASLPSNAFRSVATP